MLRITSYNVCYTKLLRVIPAVRIKLVELQRKIASENDVVMDGRDIGTYVLPHARYKFFITASLEERAKRRYIELNNSSTNNSSLEEVLKDISFRANGITSYSIHYTK